MQWAIIPCTIWQDCAINYKLWINAVVWQWMRWEVHKEKEKEIMLKEKEQMLLSTSGHILVITMLFLKQYQCDLWALYPSVMCLSLFRSQSSGKACHALGNGSLLYMTSWQRHAINSNRMNRDLSEPDVREWKHVYICFQRLLFLRMRIRRSRNS